MDSFGSVALVAVKLNGRGKANGNGKVKTKNGDVEMGLSVK